MVKLMAPFEALKQVTCCNVALAIRGRGSVMTNEADDVHPLAFVTVRE
jgi:hypothetical protein